MPSSQSLAFPAAKDSLSQGCALASASGTWAPGGLGREELGGRLPGQGTPSPRAAAESPDSVSVASTSSSAAAAPGSLYFPLKTSCPEGRLPQRGRRKAKVNECIETAGGCGPGHSAQ